jgi:hypothetical protein
MGRPSCLAVSGHCWMMISTLARASLLVFPSAAQPGSSGTWLKELWDVPSNEMEHFVLPRCLHCAADVRAARTEENVGRPGKRHAGHQRRAPVGMTEWGKSEAKRGRWRNPCRCSEETDLKVGHYIVEERSASEGGPYVEKRKPRGRRKAAPTHATPRGRSELRPYKERRRPPRKAAATRRGASCGGRGLGRFGWRLGCA